ncbi:MAG: hypothetical protein J4N95_05170 [Chloroflexi bacterium]|nr:hypothetical protein [Chloroflexota bacterium]
MSAIWRPSASISLAIAVLTSLLLLACGQTANEAPKPTANPAVSARTFAMGVSSLPAELTEKSYSETFRLAASAGEVILIQRTPPWEELLGGTFSEETVLTTQRETALAEEHGLDIFVAIDPTDGSRQRSRLAGLPDDLLGAGFSDPDIHEALIDYARYIAEAYRPKYLAFGVEINGYQQHHPEDFERFVVIYHQAYEVVKEISPETLVFPTFQFEELQGRLPFQDPLPPQWHLISRFEPRLDILAISSYPDIVFPSADEIPESYYAQLSLYTDRPIAIAGMGYSSRASEDISRTKAEESQAAFLRRTLDNAQQLDMPFVVWFVSQDPSFTGDSALDLGNSGLIQQDGTPKPAWDIWHTASLRPLQAVQPEP